MIGQYFHIRSCVQEFIYNLEKLKVKQAIYFIYAQRFPRLVGSRKGKFKVIK